MTMSCVHACVTVVCVHIHTKGGRKEDQGPWGTIHKRAVYGGCLRNAMSK